MIPGAYVPRHRRRVLVDAPAVLAPGDLTARFASQGRGRHRAATPGDSQRFVLDRFVAGCDTTPAVSAEPGRHRAAGAPGTVPDVIVRGRHRAAAPALITPRNTLSREADMAMRVITSGGAR